MGQSLTAKPFRLYRLTAVSDDSSSDFLLFNNSADPNFKNTAKEGLYLKTLTRHDPEGIGNNQAAEKADGNVQPLGIVEGTYILKGFISNMRGDSDNGNNLIVARLRSWKTEPQAILDTWEAGRFGIIDESDIDNTISPVGTGSGAIGLIFEDYTKTNDYNLNRVDIEITLRRSRGLDI